MPEVIQAPIDNETQQTARARQPSRDRLRRRERRRAPGRVPRSPGRCPSAAGGTPRYPARHGCPVTVSWPNADSRASASPAWARAVLPLEKSVKRRRTVPAGLQVREADVVVVDNKFACGSRRSQAIQQAVWRRDMAASTNDIQFAAGKKGWLTTVDLACISCWRWTRLHPGHVDHSAADAAAGMLLAFSISCPSPCSYHAVVARGAGAVHVPSMLLFTTLLRLSLNVASTVDLLHGDAGKIIQTFGQVRRGAASSSPVIFSF